MTAEDKLKPKPVPKTTKSKSQRAREARTIIWCTNEKTASDNVAKIRGIGIDVPCYAENNIVHLKRDLTKLEYKKFHPSKA